MNLQSHYKIHPSGVASEHFGDEVIVINLPKGHYYSLRFAAADFWKQLENGASVSSLNRFAHQQYESFTPEDEASIEAFVAHLLDENLIIEAQEGGSVDVAPPMHRDVFQKPVLEVFTDMQDLLLLDPVHDVDSVQGWPVKKQ